jgi:hypothetical protein
LFISERRRDEELYSDIGREEDHKYLKKAKTRRAVDGYPLEYWKELCKKNH